MNAMRIELKTYRVWSDGQAIVYDVGGVGVGTITQTATQTSTSSAPLITRVMVRTDGQDVIAVMGMASEDFYPSYSRDLMIAGATLRLQRAPQGSPEGFRRAVASNPSFEVFYPTSWSPQPVPPNAPGISAVNIALVEGQHLKGLVHVKALDTNIVAAPDPEALTSEATAEFTAAGVTLPSPWVPQTDQMLLRTPGLQRASISTASVAGSAVEVQLSVVHRPPLTFCISAIIAPPHVEPISCMRGHKAYSVALLSAKPLS